MTIFDDTKLLLVGRWNYHLDFQVPNDFHSFHATNHTGDAAFLNFTGTAVEIYGLKDPIGANFNVTLDGTTTMLSALGSTREQSLFFSKDNLDANIVHQLVMVNNEEGKLFMFDIVNTTDLTSPLPTPTPSPSSHSAAFNRGTLIAIILLAVAVFILLLSLLLFFCCRRRLKKKRDAKRADLERRMQPLQLPALRNSLLPLNTYEWMPGMYSNQPRDARLIGAAPGAKVVTSHSDESDDEHPAILAGAAAAARKSPLPKRRWDREGAITPTTLAPLRPQTNPVFFGSNPLAMRTLGSLDSTPVSPNTAVHYDRTPQTSVEGRTDAEETEYEDEDESRPFDDHRRSLRYSSSDARSSSSISLSPSDPRGSSVPSIASETTQRGQAR